MRNFSPFPEEDISLTIHHFPFTQYFYFNLKNVFTIMYFASVFTIVNISMNMISRVQ